jgi:hypothetical protein
VAMQLLQAQYCTCARCRCVTGAHGQILHDAGRFTCCRTLTRSFMTLRRRLLTTTATARYRSRCWLVVCTAFRYLQEALCRLITLCGMAREHCKLWVQR